MSANPTHQKHRDYPTDATRPRRYSADRAKREWYARSRRERFARRQGL